MTIAQAERFYEQDTKDYEIEKNKVTLKNMTTGEQETLIIEDVIKRLSCK